MVDTAGLEDVPNVPWAEFLPAFLESWPANTGGKAEHLTLVGPTGQGKSTLALELLRARAAARNSSTVILATKPKDQTLSKMGWPIVRTWPPGYGKDQVIYWPRFGDVRTAAGRQREQFHSMLAEVFQAGNRTVYIDEVFYFQKTLRLEPLLTQFWQAGRAQNILLVAGTQRPRDVPRAMFSEASWFAAFRTADQDELRRVGEIGGMDGKRIRAIMAQLQPHEFIMVQTRTGNIVRSKVEQ